MISSIIQHLFIQSQPNMSEQEKIQQKIYDLFNTETKPKLLCLLYTKQRNFLTEKELLRKRRSGGLNKK